MLGGDTDPAQPAPMEGEGDAAGRQPVGGAQGVLAGVSSDPVRLVEDAHLMAALEEEGRRVHEEIPRPLGRRDGHARRPQPHGRHLGHPRGRCEEEAEAEDRAEESTVHRSTIRAPEPDGSRCDQ